MNEIVEYIEVCFLKKRKTKGAGKAGKTDAVLFCTGSRVLWDAARLCVISAESERANCVSANVGLCSLDIAFRSVVRLGRDGDECDWDCPRLCFLTERKAMGVRTVLALSLFRTFCCSVLVDLAELDIAFAHRRYGDFLFWALDGASVHGSAAESSRLPALAAV